MSKIETLSDENQLPENMAAKIDEQSDVWGDPAEGKVSGWWVLVFLILLWLSGVAVGALLMGWRP